MKLTPDQRAAMHQWAISGEMTDLDAAKRLAAKFSQPFNPTAAQYNYYCVQAGLERRKNTETKRKKGIGKGLAIKDARIAKLERLFARHEKLMEARGQEMNGEIAGGELGLYAKDYKGKDADVAVYKYDAAFIREMRGILDDLAREEGGRKTRIEHSGKIDVTKLSDEELEAIVKNES